MEIRDLGNSLRSVLNESIIARRSILNSNHRESISYGEFELFYGDIMSQIPTLIEFMKIISTDGKFLLSQPRAETYLKVMSEFAEFIKSFESQEFLRDTSDIFFNNCEKFILDHYDSSISYCMKEYQMDHMIAWEYTCVHMEKVELMSIREFLVYFEQYVKSFLIEVYSQIGVAIPEIDKFMCLNTYLSNTRLRSKANLINLKSLYSFLINKGYIDDHTNYMMFTRIITLSNSIKKNEKIIWLDISPTTKQSNKLSLIKMMDEILKFKNGINGKRIEKLKLIAKYFSGVKENKVISFELQQLSKPDNKRLDSSPRANELKDFILSITS